MHSGSGEPGSASDAAFAQLATVPTITDPKMLFTRRSVIAWRVHRQGAGHSAAGVWRPSWPTGVSSAHGETCPPAPRLRSRTCDSRGDIVRAPARHPLAVDLRGRRVLIRANPARCPGCSCESRPSRRSSSCTGARRARATTSDRGARSISSAPRPPSRSRMLAVRSGSRRAAVARRATRAPPPRIACGPTPRSRQPHLHHRAPRRRRSRPPRRGRRHRHRRRRHRHRRRRHRHRRHSMVPSAPASSPRSGSCMSTRASDRSGSA